MSKSCRSRAFAPLLKNSMTKVIEWQRVKLQEIILDQRDNESGRIPRTVECELSEDLADSCSPGDLVTLNCVVKAITSESSGAGRSVRDKCTFVLYLNVNSVQGMLSSEMDASANAVGDGAESVEGSKSKHVKDMEFTASDLECFDEIRTEPNIFK